MSNFKHWVQQVIPDSTLIPDGRRLFNGRIHVDEFQIVIDMTKQNGYKKQLIVLSFLSV